MRRTFIEDSLKRKLQQLLYLAERGIGGEAINARAKFESICREHAINIEEFFQEEKQTYSIKYKNKGELTLINQICCMVLNVHSCKYDSREKKISYEATKLQNAEINNLVMIYLHDYNFQLNQLKEEIKLFVDAFIAKNNIYRSKDGEEKEQYNKISKTEMEKLKKIAGLCNRITPSQTRKAIATNH